jgi:hypothetical protein
MAVNFPGYTSIDEDPTKAGFGNFSGGSFSLANKNPSEVVNAILPFVFVIAGLILFAMIFFGGFTIFTSAGNPEKTKQGQGMIVNALVGFVIIFAAYWIIELLQYSLGFNVL